MIEILIEKKGGRVVFLGRPGGMRWPPGGIIGGAKDSLFEICRYLMHIMALRFGDLAFGLGIWLFGLARPAPPLRCGRRIEFPKGDHRRPPASFHSASWGKAFGIHRFLRLEASSMLFGAMLSIFSFFRKRLPDQVLRKSLVGVLGGSWELLGGF